MSVTRQTGILAFALLAIFIGIAASSNAEQFGVPQPSPGKPRPFKGGGPYAGLIQVVPLPNAHAHNDYEHKRPLFDALDHGFCSVEADVFLETRKSPRMGSSFARKANKKICPPPIIFRTGETGSQVF